MGDLTAWGSLVVGLVWGGLASRVRIGAKRPLRNMAAVTLSTLLLSATTALVTAGASAGLIAMAAAAASYSLRLHPR
jgi:hypothetical protein